MPFAPRFDSLHGSRITAQFLRELIGRHPVAVVYQRRWSEPGIDPDLATLCEQVVEVGHPPDLIGQAWRYRWDVLKAPLLGRPTAASQQHSRPFVQALRDLAASFRPDVLQIEHDTLAYCAAEMRGRSRATILVCHDPGVLAAEELAAVTRGRQRLSHRVDAHTWRRYWHQTLPEIDAAVVFSERDRRALELNSPGLPVRAIPLGIELCAEPLSARGRDGSVVFVGSYGHQPNVDAALRLIREIMPLVRRQRPELELYLVGDLPTLEMRAGAGPLDHVTGRVPSVDPYVDAAAVMALPIRVGGGMRVKLLEAMGAGKAIVASPVAAAGLEVEDGRQMMIASSDEEFVAAILRLSGDAALRESLGHEARSWAGTHLRWSARVDQYDLLYDSLLGDQRLATAA